MKKTFLLPSPPVRLMLITLLGMFFINIQGYAQSRNNNFVVVGTVIDYHGEPLPGVNVVEVGTSRGTITNADGQYMITTSGKDVKLSFSFIGYITKEISTNGKKKIDVTLEEDTQDLEEVVVIGYGTAKKKDLTGAISTVKAEKLEAESPRSVQDLLRANTAGLTISMSTDAAGTADLQIRGKNTLTAGSSPLLVLDGVIYEGSLKDINPNDIQSIDVLKDASSAAVYGAKAANGVVVITTKKGKTGKPIVSFNANVGFVQTSHLPKTVDGPGFIRFRQDYEEGKTTDADLAKYPGKFADPRTLSAYGVDALTWYNYTQKTPVTELPSEEQMLTTWLTRLEMKAPEIANYLAGNVTNWDDLVFQNGFQQDYTASISNRTDNMSYYWSLGYTDREGVKVGERFTNFRTRLNLESKVTKFLTIGMNSSFSSRDNGHLTADVGQRENLSPYAANEIDNPDSEYRMYPTGDNNSTNPFFHNLYRDRKDMTHTLNANIYAQLFLPFGFEYQMNFTPYYEWNEYYNHESSKDPEWKAKGGNSERTNKKNFKWQIDNIIRWKKRFNNIHNFEVTLLANAEKGQYWETKAQNSNYSPSDVLGYHRLQAGTVPIVSSNDTYRTGDALMGRVFYSFKDRYMVTASVRRDGYSAFGQMNPRATFPAVALGWVFSSEKFLEKTSDWLSYGKLRFSWGQNGNRDIGQYEALSDMTSGLHPYIDQNGNLYVTSQLYVNRMANKALKWERTQSYNVGLDFGLFNDILSGSMEIYMAETNDLLVKRSLPEIIGFNEVMSNLGKLSNKGFELSLNANIISNKNFAWNSSGTFSFNRRKILELYGDMVDVLDEEGNVIGQKEADDVKNKWFIGHDPDQIWEYERDGVWQLDEKEEAAKYGLQPGDFKYVDQNDDGVMTDKDRVFQGYKTPRFRWSWRNEFTFYKNFSLSFMMYSNIGQYGTYNRAANAVSLADRRTWFDQPRWTRTNPEEDYARIGSKNIGSNYIKKSFVRLENVTLSYNVPQKFLKKISVQNMRFSLSVRNVGILAPNWEFGDPEGGDITPRTFNLGVNFSL